MAALIAAAPAAADAGADLRAEQIREETASALLIGGPDAIGGVGDWYLANEIVEVIVDDPTRRFAKNNHGGRIVDAGLRDRRDEDQFAELFPLLNLDQRVDLMIGQHQHGRVIVGDRGRKRRRDEVARQR